MSGRYSAFTLCDRITDFVPAKSARARFLVPPHLDEFAACLVAEAVGQLAAWVAMAHIGFRGRPVAALAGETRFGTAVAPGETLELEIDIEQCDDEVVAYGGRATCGGREVLRLLDCVGPMLPQGDYDSADDLARQFELLLGAGARPGRFGGVGRAALTFAEQTDAQRRDARLDVPADAGYFFDHFPRRPVFPATLLLDSAIRVATDLVGAAAWRPQRMTHVKMRDFVLPGQQVELSATTLARTDQNVRIGLGAKVGERTVATARVEFAAKDRPA